MKSKEHYTKLPITREPVDKMAALVVSKGWNIGESKKKIVIDHWEICPPLRKYDRDCPHPNLTDIKFGRMIVVGLFKPFYRDHYMERFYGDKCIKVSWICKCACGDFEPRKMKAILNPNNQNDACHKCRHIEELRHCEERRRLHEIEKAHNIASKFTNFT